IFICIILFFQVLFFFFSSRRRHTRSKRDWSSDVCSSDLYTNKPVAIFSLEMPAEQLVMRMFASIGGIEQGKIRTGELNDIEAKRSEERRVGKECRSRWAREE